MHIVKIGESLWQVLEHSLNTRHGGAGTGFVDGTQEGLDVSQQNAKLALGGGWLLCISC
jgi:hypothetical protein